MKPTTLLLTLVLACAGQSTPEDAEVPDESSETAAPPKEADACDPPDLDLCTEGEDVAACAKTAIKYEYEMLDARHRGDTPAFECHRDTLASVLDHACGLGDEEACTRAPKIRGAGPSA
jgi:hypothetical protein